MHFIIITPAAPQIIRHSLPEIGDPCSRVAGGIVIISRPVGSGKWVVTGSRSESHDSEAAPGGTVTFGARMKPALDNPTKREPEGKNYP